MIIMVLLETKKSKTELVIEKTLLHNLWITKMNLMTIMVLLRMITQVRIFNLLNFLTNCLTTMR